MKAIFRISTLALIILSSCSLPCKRESPQSLDYPPELRIVRRAEWGWKPLSGSVPKQQQIRKITIHHGGTDFFPEDDPVAHIRNLQNWSRDTKHWIDIPYHYMMDLDGVIYEARPLEYAGDTNHQLRSHRARPDLPDGKL